MAMALEMDRIIECGVIDLVMWVVALSSKGGGLTMNHHFQKEKCCKLYVFFLRVS